MHGAVVVGVVGSCKSLSLGFSHKELNNMWFCFLHHVVANCNPLVMD